MVITKHFLADKLGLDFEIAEFFADRKLPKNNLYWKGQFLYLSSAFRFLFIPMLADIVFKSGVEKAVVIDPARIERMERSFDIVMHYEHKGIDFDEYISQMSEVFRPYVKNQDFFEDLILHFKSQPSNYYRLGSGVAALDRADAYLFNFTDLIVDKDTLNLIIKRWYYFAVAHLMLDDFVDLEDDRNKGEENALLELGDNRQGLEKAKAMMETNIAGLGETSPLLSAFFDTIYQKTLTDAPILALMQK